MLVSDIELFHAQDKFAHLRKDRYATFDDDGPAQVHIMVRLPGAQNIGHDNILVAVLYVQQHSGDRLDASLPWTEENRVTITPECGMHFTPFDYQFFSNRRYDLQIDFQVTTMGDKDTVTNPVGHVRLQLADVIAGERERLDVNLLDANDKPILNKKAELRVEWCKCVDDKLFLEVRVKIQKRSGWPFSTARPFYILYRWEPLDASWSPLYRSEILTKVSASPHANGCMIFHMAELDFLKDITGDDDRPLRVEFFHYKTTSAPKLLGYFSTSLLDMRQAKTGNELNLTLNTFPEGELVGKLTMNASRLTSRRCFFSLQAEFGGEVAGVFVYFDIRLIQNNATPTRRRKRNHESRLVYTISRYGDNGKWEQIYESEPPSRAIGNRLHKYKVAKFTERKLNGCSGIRSLSITFWHHVPGSNRLKVGHFETTVSHLLEAQPGTVLQLYLDGNNCGIVRIEQAEETESRRYFAIQCELDNSPTKQHSPSSLQQPIQQHSDISTTPTRTDSSPYSQPDHVAT